MPPPTENFDPAKVTANTNGQKQAILQALAQGGSDLARTVATGQGQVGSMQQAAIQQAAAGGSAAGVNPQFQQDQNARITGQAGYYRDLMGAQGASQQRTMDAGAAANSQYMDQVNAAVPIAHEQTQRQLDSLQAAASNAEADRAMRLQLGQLSMQETQARINAAGQANDPNSLDGQYRQAQIGEMNARTNAIAHPVLSPSDQINQKRLDEVPRLDALQKEIASQLGPKAAEAFNYAVNSSGGDAAKASLNMQTAIDSKLFTTPAGKKLDTAYMQNRLATYFSRQ